MSLFRLVFILAAASVVVRQFAGAATDLPRRIEVADTIVVANAQFDTSPADSTTLRLKVVRTIKGPLAPGETILARWNGGAGGETTDLYGLWFLKRLDGSGWAVMNSAQGTTLLQAAFVKLSGSASPSAIMPVGQRATAEEMIAAELSASITQYKNQFHLHIMATELRSLGGTTIARNLYQSLRTHSDPELRFIALAGLTARGDLSALREITDQIDLLKHLRVGAEMVADVVRPMRAADTETVLLLGRIAASEPDDVRLSAAQALAYIHTRDTLPFLAQLLEAPDKRSREFAMLGFSRFTENLPVETPETMASGKDLIPVGPATYRTPATVRYSLATRTLSDFEESDYLNFWRGWWAEMKSKISAAGN